MSEKETMKLYMWPFRSKHTIFVLAPNLEKAKEIAIEKAVSTLKNEVTAVVSTTKPNVTDHEHSFIFETGAQLIG